MTSEWKTWKEKEKGKPAVNRNGHDDKQQPKTLRGHSKEDLNLLSLSHS